MPTYVLSVLPMLVQCTLAVLVINNQRDQYLSFVNSPYLFLLHGLQMNQIKIQTLKEFGK